MRRRRRQKIKRAALQTTNRSPPRTIPGKTMPENAAMSDPTRIVREPIRAVYDRDAIYAILDEGFVCHVGFTADSQTFVIPTMYARVGDAIYFHGSAASRMLRGVSTGLNVCVTVTFADAIVL